jgi:hypothetical protein
MGNCYLTTECGKRGPQSEHAKGGELSRLLHLPTANTAYGTDDISNE